MNRGDIVRVQLPRPGGSPGHEQFGTRPAVVVQDDPRLANLPTSVVVPITSNLGAIRFAGSVVVEPSANNGLSMKSVILTHQVRAIDRRRIEERLGSLSSDELAQLEVELIALLAISAQ